MLQLCWINLGKEGLLPARGNLDDRRPCPLQVADIVKVADQDIVLLQPSDGIWNNSHTIGIDVTIGWDGRGNGTNGVEAPEIGACGSLRYNERNNSEKKGEDPRQENGYEPVLAMQGHYIPPHTIENRST